MFTFEKDITNYLDIEYEDFVVTELLSKYEIETKSSFLYNQNDDYRALIEYISNLYIDEKDIPSDIISELQSNLYFKAFLIVVVNEKMNNILFDNTTIIFKEIVTIVNLLSFGNKYKIFESYNYYNLEELGNLFREYERRLKEIETDTNDFQITFGQYVTLIEAINELCMINSTDVLRKKSINPLVNTITETINLVKFNVTLNNEEINTLNNILGKLLFFYSHIPYINTSNKNSQYLIDEYTFNFEKIRDGYHLSKNTNFGADTENEKYYKIFLNSITTILSTLIYKLEITYRYSDYNDIEKFKNILEIYNQEITHTDIQKFKTVEEFKLTLLKNYNFIYNDKLQTDDYLYIVEDFLQNPDFNSSNMIMLHSLILYSPNIEDEKLLKILEILISLDKFKNDYHEFYKISICDVIINKFIYFKREVISNELGKNLIAYIEHNKIASHLMSVYSKIYLTLSLYYSNIDKYESIEQSKLFYYNFIAINGTDILENEYSNLNKEILYNHGKRSINEFDINNIDIPSEKYVEIGFKVLNKFSIQQDINLKYNINQKLSNIVTEIFTDEGLNDDLLNSHIEAFISRDMFHGLAFVSVEGLCEKECHLIDLGYERIDIPLISGYKLKMAYSNVYKNIFEKIYEKNKDYIKQNIINLIISYIKSIPIYKDSITLLNNIDKLQKDILSKEDEFIFIELYINNLINLNKKYNYNKTNILFKEYSNEINILVPTYRLTGPKLGFLLDKDEDYKSMIEKIKKLKMYYNNKVITPDLTFAVSWGNKENILEKSSYCMSLAQKEDDKYYEFK